MAGLGRSVRRWRDAYRRWRYDWDGRVPVTMLPVAVVLGVLLGLWWGRMAILDGSEAAPESARARLSEGVARGLVTPGPVERCARVHASRVPALEAVGPALAQWQVHMGAMNKLVVGSISAAQLREYWDGTRVAAVRGLGDFGKAQRTHERITSRCPAPEKGASDRLRTCAAAVASQRRALAAAEVALDEWRTHVHDMEMLRRGDLTPAELTLAWQERGGEGRRQVRLVREGLRDVSRSSPRSRRPGTGRPCPG